jgi:hypothetical protein
VTVAAFESWRRSHGRRPRTAADVTRQGVDPTGSRLAADR